MSKTLWKPGTMVYPVPAVMVSCGSERSEYNIITIAWTGTICTEPAMCYISVRPERHSYNILQRNKEFVINLTTKKLSYATDWCGVKSGREYDKFKEMQLTPGKANSVKAPIIVESPVHIECVVKDIIPLGTHHLFTAEVVAIQADNQYIDEKSGALLLEKARPICYSHGKYYMLGEKIGKFGFSVQKKPPKKK